MTQEEKIELARDWKSIGYSNREIAKLLGVRAPVVRAWLNNPQDAAYLLPDDVARILSVAPAKVRKWCGTGELKATNLNTGLRPHFVIRREDLDHFIQSRQSEPQVLRVNRRPFDVGSFKRYRA